MFCQNQQANWILPPSPPYCLPPFSVTDSKIVHVDATFLCVMVSFALFSVIPFSFLLNFVPSSSSPPLYINEFLQLCFSQQNLLWIHSLVYLQYQLYSPLLCTGREACSLLHLGYICDDFWYNTSLSLSLDQNVSSSGWGSSLPSHLQEGPFERGLALQLS